MDPDVLHQVRCALQTVHDHNFTQDQRAAANHYCEDFKNDLKKCLPYTMALCNDTNAYVSHFGFHLLENAINFHWLELGFPERQTFCGFALQLMQCSITERSDSNIFKAKTSSLISLLARKEWPRRWVDLFPTLFSFAEQKESSAEFVLQIFKTFFEDVIQFPEHLGDRRKRDILTGLREESKLLPFFKSFIIHYLTNPSPSSLSLAFSAMAALVPLLETAHLKDIVSFELPQIFVKLCTIEPLKLSASNLLLTLATNRSNTNDEKIALFFLLKDDFFHTFANCVRTSVEKSGKDHHLFVTQAAQIFTIVLCNYFTLFEKKLFEFDSFKDLENNLSIMFAFFTHPSLVIHSLVSQFWNSLFRAKRIQTEYHQQIQQILPIFLSGILNKLLSDKEISQSEKQYAVLDFESEEDCIEFRSKINSKLGELIRSSCSSYPEQVLEFSVNELANTFSEFDKSNESSYRKLDNAIFFFTNAFVPVSPENNKASESNHFIIQCFQKALAILLSPKDQQSPFLIMHQLDGLKAIVPFFLIDPNHIKEVLSLSMNTCSYIPSNESISLLSSDTVETRRKALTLLLRLAVAIPVPLVPFLPQLAKWANEFIKSEMLLEGEKISLLESLAAISNSVSTQQEQEAFLRELVSTVLAEWVDDNLTRQLFSARNFFTFITGYAITNNSSPSPVPFLHSTNETNSPNKAEHSHSPHSPTSALMNNTLQIVHTPSVSLWSQVEDFSTVIVRIRKFYNLLYTLHNIWRRCSQRSDTKGWAIAPQIPVVLPNLVSFLQSLHCMWQTDFMFAVPEEWKIIFDIPESARAALSSHKNTNKKASTPQEHVIFIIENTRDWAYHMLGWASQRGALLQKVPNVSNSLSQTVLIGIESLNNRHLVRLFTKFVVPFTLNCPLQYYQTCTCFTVVINEVYHRLSAVGLCKRANNTIPVRSTSADSENSKFKQFRVEQAEIINEKLLAELASEFIDWIKLLVSDSSLKKEEVTERAAYFLNTESALGVAVLQCFLEVLRYPNSSVIRKAIQLGSKIVASFTDNYSLSIAFLRAVLQTYSLPQAEDFNYELCNLFNELLCGNLSVRRIETAQALAEFNPDDGISNELKLRHASEFVNQLFELHDNKKQVSFIKGFLQPIAELRLIVAQNPQRTTRQFAMLYVDSELTISL